MSDQRRILAEPPARSVVAACYAAALAGAQPGPAVAAALASYPLLDTRGVHVIALGKAAPEMAHAAVEALAARGVVPAGGLVVAHRESTPPCATLRVMVGDHPIPGSGSAAAARALGDVAARVGRADTALVLVSGGTSSLIGAPAAHSDLTPDDVAATSRVLLAAGVPIDLVNALRKRVSRWGAGRLARALAPARVLCLAVSDVPSDDPAVIGSGPCTPDPWTAEALRDALAAHDIRTVLPHAVRDYLDSLVAVARAHPRPAAPQADDPAFDRVLTRVVRTNADARAAAAEAARAAGFAVIVHDTWLAGEAAPLGRSLASTLLAGPPRTVHVWGGEPTVTLGGPPGAYGGRMQELALAAAGVLHAAGSQAGDVAFLAAGTDGRDGPTDAAGAIVGPATWAAMRVAGHDPDADLAEHRSGTALASAAALLPTTPTGTNVADVVIALAAGSAGSDDGVRGPPQYVR